MSKYMSHQVSCFLLFLLCSGAAKSQEITFENVLDACKGGSVIFGEAEQGKATFDDGITLLREGNTIRYIKNGTLIEELAYESPEQYLNCIERFSTLFGFEKKK